VDATTLLQFVIAGLKNGSIYALVALGFTIVYAATGVINFAQGEFYMLGGMISVFVLTTMHVPLLVAVLSGVAGTVLVGATIERFALRPRRDSSPLVLIIITIGVSLLLRSLARHAFGADELALPAFSSGDSIMLFGAAIERQTLWVWGVTLVAVTALWFIYEKTTFGRAMRACSISHEASRLMGIDTARVVSISFMLAAALGAVAGIVVAPLTQTAFDVGARMGLKGFAAAILGGLGDFRAAVAGGLVLGLVESLAVGFIDSTYKDAIALVLLLAVLFIRPQGLFGASARRAKV
jgi:branched-chain amino acid transport system permease protein